MSTRRGCCAMVGAMALLLFAGSAAAVDLGDLAKQGDLAAVTMALEEGTPVDQLEGGVTALYVASEQGNVELAKLLIDRGADVNLTVKLQRTPLYAAVKAGQPAIVELLLGKGADPNKLAKRQTPLHVAAESGCLQCVVALVDAGAKVNALLETGAPPIHFAKRGGHEDIVSYLLEHGAGPEPIAPISPLLASAEVSLGKQIFKKTCVTCHIATSAAEDSRRPNLWSVVGRLKASESDVQYSSALKSAGGTWSYEDLNAFIAHPALTVPGTDMSIAGLPGENERANLIGYLRTLSESPVPLP
ncbi:MAG: c-type cytochrome [Alphaproteobacteria bacterium]|nr:MAG: c-type cytochrome [Alphaproteobacteria bacterium]